MQHNNNNNNNNEVFERPFSVEPKARTANSQTNRHKVPDTKNSHTAHTNVSLTLLSLHLHLKRISKPKHTRLKFDLKKLKDPNVLETFRTMIGGKFAPLTIMSNEDADIDSMITTFNTAVTETASEILGTHRQKKKKPWVTAEILVLCDKRRELRKKRFKPGGSEKYKEVNNNIKRCMKRPEKTG